MMQGFFDVHPWYLVALSTAIIFGSLALIQLERIRRTVKEWLQ